LLGINDCLIDQHHLPFEVERSINGPGNDNREVGQALRIILTVPTIGKAIGVRDLVIGIAIVLSEPDKLRCWRWRQSHQRSSLISKDMEWAEPSLAHVTCSSGDGWRIRPMKLRRSPWNASVGSGTTNTSPWIPARRTSSSARPKPSSSRMW